jgi:UPF0755 protein
MRRGERKRSGCRGSILAILGFLFIAAVAGGIFLWSALTLPYRGYEGESVRVEVKRGTSTPRILEQLRRAGVLRDDFVPMIYLRTIRRGAPLKAGLYEFSQPKSPIEVIDKLVRGDVVIDTVTIREGLDRFQIASVMVQAGFGSEEEWERVTSDPALISELDPEAASLEGYLFPDTYHINPGTAVPAIARQMVENFRRQFGPEIDAITTGLSLHQTVTLASIIETEARIPEERPIVASVYMNRTRIGMPLQADPTVIYALKLAGEWDGRITREGLRFDSPYNTYRYRGFPPGPIANPGLASLRAAASPAETNFLYFVSRNDGSHVFSTNLADHNRAVERWQRQYWRDKRAAEQAQETVEQR